VKDASWGSVYKEIGGQPVINAIGSVTLLGGSTPVAEIREAMERANEAFIPLSELEEKAGAAIAEMLGVPAAYVTSGAASALTLGTAAFIAGDDDEKIEQLPDTTGMKNEVLIQKRQRYWYDRCLELAGGKLVEFGTDEGTTEKDLEDAIGPKTAVVAFVGDERPGMFDPKVLHIEQIVRIAHARDVPVMVDAAGQVYPIENISKYVRAGADFSCIGAKYMGSPHSTGFALGTKETIRKLALQSFVGYEARRVRGVGRPQKLDRHEIIGVVAAVRRWVTMNHEERLADYEQRSSTLAKLLAGIPGVEADVIDNVVGNQPFGVSVKMDPSVTGMTLQDVVDRLQAGDPPIWTRVNPSYVPGGTDAMTLSMFGLNEGEEVIVGERIRALLKK